MEGSKSGNAEELAATGSLTLGGISTEVELWRVEGAMSRWSTHKDRSTHAIPLRAAYQQSWAVL